MSAVSRRPILFASIDEAGHINPLLAIAGELSRRGIPDLWFASTLDGRDGARPAIPTACRTASFGASVVDLPDTTYAEVARPPRSPAAALGLARWLLNPGRLAAEYDRLLEQIDRIRPRLMVIDLATYSALAAARARGVPYVLSVPSLISTAFREVLPLGYPQSLSGLPRRMSRTQHLANVVFAARAAVTVLRGLREPVAEIRRRLGIARPLDGRCWTDAATAIFGYTIFGLEYEFPVPDKVHLLGSMVPAGSEAARLEDPLASWLARSPSVVYVQMGTLIRLTRTQVAELVAAFSRLEPAQQVLWSLREPQQALLPPAESRPGNLRVEPWVPQPAVLAHPNVRAFITHGGANSVHEGLAFGKPLLAMPFWLDGYDLAARVVDSGAGLAMDRPPAFTAREVATKVRRLLDEQEFTARAGLLAERLRQAGGVARAADLVLLAASSPAPASAGAGT